MYGRRQCASRSGGLCVLAAGYVWDMTCSGVDAWCRDNHVESICCHAGHAVEANTRDSQTVSADRRTDLGTAVYAYMCEYGVYGTVKYRRECLYRFAF